MPELCPQIRRRKIQAHSYIEHVHEITKLKVNVPGHDELFNELGGAITDFAVRPVYRQL